METQKNLSERLGDIRECDREAIHLSGAVQGHGCILFFTARDQRVQSASQNVHEVLGLEHPKVLGAKLDHLLEPRFVHLIEQIVREFPWNKSRGRYFEYQGAQDSYDVYIFESEGVFGLEIEKIAPVTQDSFSLTAEISQNLREFMLELKDARDTSELAGLLCQRIRKITGVDRAMMYRFLEPNWHGEVIAEDRVIGAHSFMKHRFPASDIPRPARELYLRNQVRLIANIEKPISPILPILNPMTKKTLDLSDSRLRSVAPIHLEYLGNMGVKASFSVAVQVEGQLWGLVACHHHSPFYLSQTKRAACELITNAFAAHGPMLEVLSSHRSRMAFDLKLRKVFESLRFSVDPLDHLFRQYRSMNEMFNATGMAFVSPTKIDAAGLTPPRPSLQALGDFLRAELARTGDVVFQSTQILTAFPDWKDYQDIASGLLAVLVPELDNALLIFFRPELIRTITWGGDPVKQLDKKNFKGQLNPRKSFEAWEETIRNQSLDWKTYEVDGILFLRDVVFDALVIKQRTIHELSDSVQRLRRGDES